MLPISRTYRNNENLTTPLMFPMQCKISLYNRLDARYRNACAARRHRANASHSQGDGEGEDEGFNATSSTFPINSLPTELLTSIFSLVTEEVQDPMNPECFNASLLFVCRLWYEIIIKNPIFWSFIKVNCQTGTDSALMVAQCLYIHAALAHTRGRPLDIVLNFHHMEGYAEEVAKEVVNDRINMVLDPVDILRGEDDSVCTRWRTLTIILPKKDGRLSTGIAKYFEGIYAPNLERLDILRGRVPTGHVIESTDLFILGPRLRQLSMNCISMKWISLAPDSLEHLDIVLDRGWGGLLSILSQTKLKYLKIRKDSHAPLTWEGKDWRGYLDDTGPTTFTSLKKLVIRGIFDQLFYALFQFRALRKLDVSGESALDLFKHNNSFHSSITEMVWSASRDLKDLSFSETAVYKESLVQRLKTLGSCYFPSLKTMELPVFSVGMAYPALSMVMATKQLTPREIDNKKKVVYFAKGTPGLQ